MDITFYRDDVQVRGEEARSIRSPSSAPTSLAFPLEGMTCVLVDDVLYMGRTIRAAIEALFDYGRPAPCSSPASPTAATESSRSAPTTSARTFRLPASERVQVQLVEIDEVDQVLLIPAPEESAHG